MPSATVSSCSELAPTSMRTAIGISPSPPRSGRGSRVNTANNSGDEDMTAMNSTPFQSASPFKRQTASRSTWTAGKKGKSVEFKGVTDDVRRRGSMDGGVGLRGGTPTQTMDDEQGGVGKRTIGLKKSFARLGKIFPGKS